MSWTSIQRRIRPARWRGLIYPEGSPFGFNGGYYYVGLKVALP